MLGLLVFLGLLTLSGCGVVANSVGIYDNARVLNAAQVKNAASSLPNHVDIYTVNTFTGTKADFERAAVAKVGSNPNRIVIAIDTAHNYLYIARGSSVPLSGAAVSQAVGAFATNYTNGDYTRATVAALGSIKGALNASASPSFSPLALACLPLLLIGLFLLLMRARARRPAFYGYPQGYGSQQGGPYQPARQPGMPYDQDGYGPYGSPMQRGGVNPWMAGGLGAAAGGLAGYELGRMQGERRDDSGGSFGQGADNGDMGAGGSFGNGGDFGGGGSFGNGADFGGGGNDFGGSGSFGNGGDFGGGGSFGSDDFGGGGNF